jgi:hypothetical protein
VCDPLGIAVIFASGAAEQAYAARATCAAR